MNHRVYVSVTATAIGLLTFLLYWFSLPAKFLEDPFCTVLEDASGELLGARISDDGQWRFPQIDSLPPKYKQCLLLYEDRYFYYHPGVNPAAILRAVFQNLRSGEIVSGGSTLSMQLIRLSRKGKPRTPGEKLIEIILATRLELKYSKEEIICMYASHAPMGGNVVGLDAASWRYFGRSPGELSWSESAMLAVLPNSPALVHPGRNREALVEKRNLLLERLVMAGQIDSLTCELAMLENLPDRPHSLPSLTPHLLDHASRNFKGKRLRSSIDADIQSKLNSICGNHQNDLAHNQIHNVSCLVLDTESGAILAYVGNATDPGSEDNSAAVDIVRSPRSTGSILKPLLFCLMIENGDLLQESLVPDIPTQYTGYSPKNFSMEYDGAVPAKRALARSLNIPAVRMLQSYGLTKFHHQLKSMDMNTLTHSADHYGLSLILGGCEGTLLWITGMYASLGRILLRYNRTGSYDPSDYHQPWYIPGISDKNDPSPPGISAASIWLTFQSLVDVYRPESRSGWKLFESAYPVAWKTGTSFGFRDAWAIGSSPEYTVGVWCGNADGEGRPGLTGISAAAPVLFEVFDLLGPVTWFREPDGELFSASICRQSGYLPGPFCQDFDTTFLTEKGLLSKPCPYHILAHISKDGRTRINADCAPGAEIRHESWFVLPPVQEWYYRQKNPNYRLLPPLHPDCGEDLDLDLMEMIYPRHSARVYVPRELDGTPGKVVLEAAHRSPETLIYWHLDEDYIGKTRFIHQLGIQPSTGIHNLHLVDENGNTYRHQFEVVDR